MNLSSLLAHAPSMDHKRPSGKVSFQMNLTSLLAHAPSMDHKRPSGKVSWLKNKNSLCTSIFSKGQNSLDFFEV